MDDDTREYEAREDAGIATGIEHAPIEARRPLPADLESSRTRRWIPWLVTLLLLAAVIGGLIWFLPHSAPTAPRGGRFTSGGPMPVVSAAVAAGDMPITLDALGTVTPLATVTVRTQINGQLTQIAFQEGQHVKKGDFLAQIDPRPYQIALEQAEAQLAKDAALLKNAQLDLARYQKLLKQDSISQQQRDTQEYLVRQYEGTVKADQAQVDSAKLNLTYCRIVAPISGRVGLRQVDVGNYVQTSDSGGIVVITQLQPISVIFTLPEDDLRAVMPRLQAGASLPVTVYDRSRTTVLATGTLATVDNQIDTTTGTVKLRATFDNADEALFPNQFVNARLLVDTLKGAMIVPTAAIQRGAPGTFVYVIGADGTVTIRTVKLGPTDGERVAIENGLEQGEKVVVDGADKLRDGAKVRLPAAPGAPAPAAAAPKAAAAASHGHRGKRAAQGTQ
jgi:multidrug efflux system membrane fusion protein